MNTGLLHSVVVAGRAGDGGRRHERLGCARPEKLPGTGILCKLVIVMHQRRHLK